MHPRIRTQAYLVSALPLIFLLLVFALAILIQQTSEQSERLEQRAQRILSQENAIESLIADASRGAVKKGTPDIRPIDVLDRRLGAEQAARLSLALQEGHLARIAQQLSPLERDAVGVIRQYAQFMARNEPERGKALAESAAVTRLGSRLNALQAGFKSAVRTLELSDLASRRLQTAKYEWALIVCCAAGILLTLMVSGRFGLGIAERLQRLAQNAEHAAAGEQVEPLEGRDEFSDLDKVYRAMMLRIAREHAVASTLQRVLLPERLPKVDGIRIDSIYSPAAAKEGVGGDWYDVFALDDRTLCISIGDVAGHGVRAAALMAGARLAIRAAARIDATPANILKNANHVVSADEPDTVVTAFVATLDLNDGTLRYASAGHPPPLLLSPTGDVSFLEARGFMLGADPRATYEEHDTPIKEGWALVLYTDGIIEARRDYFRGQDDLVAAARAEFSEPGENIAEKILHRVTSGVQMRDDAAVLFLGVTKLGVATASRRSWRIDAREEASSRRVKRALLWQLGEIAEAPCDFSAVELIYGELIGNVARHTPGPAEVSLDLSDGCATLRVADRGTAFTPSHNGADLLSESGRGLFLVRMMAKELHVEHAAGGNVVTAVLPIALAG